MAGLRPRPFLCRIGGGESILEQASAIGDVAFRCDQDDAFVVLAIGEAEAEEFGHERTNLFFGEIDHTGDLAADQAFGRVIFGDLG